MMAMMAMMAVPAGCNEGGIIGVEALQLVFACLSARDLAAACCCCRSWRDAGFGADHLWRALCFRLWPACKSNEEAVRVICAMGGHRLFFCRRILSMSPLPRQLQVKPWLRLDHLSFFVDLSYKESPLLSQVFPGALLSRGTRSLSLGHRIDPPMATAAVLPRLVLTPLFYQGQLYYEKPFQGAHAGEYCLNWSVVRSTDHKMACLLNSRPAADAERGQLPWDRHADAAAAGEEYYVYGGDEPCLPLLFQSELRGEGSLAAGVLRQPPLLSFACVDFRPLWGPTLNHPMQFKLVHLQLGIWRPDEWSPPLLDKALLALQDLDWK